MKDAITVKNENYRPVTINYHRSFHSFDKCLYGQNDECEVWHQPKEYFHVHQSFLVLFYSHHPKIHYFLAMWNDKDFYFHIESLLGEPF